MRNQRKFTVVIERDEDGYYIGTVPSLPGCHTQAKTLDTLMKRMREAVELCLESKPGDRPRARIGRSSANLDMTRLPRLKGKEIIRILERAGFQMVRSKGSHAFLKHPTDAQQSCLCIRAKRLGRACCAQFSATWK